MINGGNLSIELNHAFFLSDTFVPGVYLSVDPCGKRLTDNGIDHIGNVPKIGEER